MSPSQALTWHNPSPEADQGSPKEKPLRAGETSAQAALETMGSASQSALTAVGRTKGGDMAPGDPRLYE